MAEYFFPRGSDLHHQSRSSGDSSSASKDCMHDLWQTLLTNENILQFCALCACTVLVAYLLTEIIGVEPPPMPPKMIRAPMYGYSVFNGPHTWKETFPAARGQRQSPVNIITQDVVMVKNVPCLCWKNYSCTPLRITITNNGMTVVLQGVWPEGPPALQGTRGVVDGVYQFQAAFFRWGMSDNEGSEHTINYMQYPLELQVLHSRNNPQPPPSPTIIIVSYFFELTDVDNPYMDQIILGLQHIVFPGKCYEMQPFPLMWIAPPFQDQYFAYDGSLTFPPCCENTRWLVRPVTIGISVKQVEQFRQLLGWDGPLLFNNRPVQCMQNRDIFFYPPCKPCSCDTEPHPCTVPSRRLMRSLSQL